MISVPAIKKDSVINLEKWIDGMTQELEPLAQFILPGGNKVAAKSFLTRAICRRAERSLVKLSDHYEIDIILIKYLNRLSDAFFVFGRYLNKKTNTAEIVWKK